MLKTPELLLPYPSYELETDNEVHQRLAATSLEHYVDEMEGLDRVLSLPGDRDLRVIDLRASNEADSSKAVVLPLPWGNDYSAAMHIRARALQEYLPEDIRLLVVPNNTDKDRYYELHENSAPVKELGHMILAGCEFMEIEEIAIAGYSQGATVGASMLSESGSFDVNVEAAYLGDPANVVSRTAKQLKKAFVGEGLGELNQAINDSGLPALSEAQHSRGGLDSVKQILGLRNVLASSKVKENVMLHEGMTGNDFLMNIHSAINQGFDPKGLIVAKMEKSGICTQQLVVDMVRTGLTKYLDVIQGYNHGGGDNVIDNALRARYAFQSGGFITT